ncbi:MAG: cell division protein FtsQ/DivIB [Pseudonocardiaceae bacterium]
MGTGGHGVSGRPRGTRRDAHRPSAAARERRASGRRRGIAAPPPGVRPVPPHRGPQRVRRPSRPGRQRRGWLVAAVLVVLAALAGAVVWVLWESSLFEARSVQVIGTRELSVDEVRTVAAVPLGTPMLRLDTEAVQARVAALPRVAAVEVSRSLGGTVRLVVTERTPVAVRPAPDGVHLVDATGTAYAVVPVPPPGLPELRVARIAPGDRPTMAALTVLTGLPDPLRVQVLSVGAESAADVVLRLSDEREVRWGGVEAGDRKAAVLLALLTQPGEIYDVSSPDLPTIS